MFSIKTHICST